MLLQLYKCPQCGNKKRNQWFFLLLYCCLQLCTLEFISGADGRLSCTRLQRSSFAFGFNQQVSRGHFGGRLQTLTEGFRAFVNQVNQPEAITTAVSAGRVSKRAALWFLLQPTQTAARRIWASAGDDQAEPGGAA